MSFYECSKCGAVPGITYDCTCKQLNEDSSNLLYTDNQNRKTQERREKFLENLNTHVHLNLRDIVLEVFDSNPSQAPYHNNQHMMAVTNRAIDLFFSECKLNGVHPNQNTLQRLFIACAFHDWNHSGGKFKDSINIDRAIEGVRKLNLCIQEFKYITQIIKCTEYPFLPWFDPYSLSEKCIRDANLLVILEDDFDQFMEGLSKEQGTEITRESSIKFLKEQTFYTETAKSLKF